MVQISKEAAIQEISYAHEPRSREPHRAFTFLFPMLLRLPCCTNGSQLEQRRFAFSGNLQSLNCLAADKPHALSPQAAFAYDF